MLFNQMLKKKHPISHTNSKGPFAPTCLVLACIFSTAIIMSGCVVHHKGHGYKRGHGHGHGHHKSKVKIKPAVGVSVSPMIVIDD
jgi:hypothetical protein